MNNLICIIGAVLNDLYVLPAEVKTTQGAVLHLLTFQSPKWLATIPGLCDLYMIILPSVELLI